jgi:hypothetical protein
MEWLRNHVEIDCKGEDHLSTISRRRFLGASATLPSLAVLPTLADDQDDEAINKAPPELGFADFAEAWEYVGEETPSAAFVPKIIPRNIVLSYQVKMHGHVVQNDIYEEHQQSLFSLYNNVASSSAIPIVLLCSMQELWFTPSFILNIILWIQLGAHR